MPVESVNLKGRNLASNTQIIHPSCSGDRLERSTASYFSYYFLNLSNFRNRFRGFVPLAGLSKKSPAYDKYQEALLRTAEDVIFHIKKVHLTNEQSILEGGVPRFDLELMQYQGYDATEIVEYIYGLLSLTEFTRSQTLSESDLVLIKTLLYIDELKIAKVDWARLKVAFVDIDKVKLNIDEDSSEGGFYFVAAIEEAA